jgi:hypothetical protein
MGTEEDEWEIIKYYGTEMIKKNIVKIKVFDMKTLNYVSVLFKIPRDKFVCYTNNAYQKIY